jgi:hypothetical protein
MAEMISLTALWVALKALGARRRELRDARNAERASETNQICADLNDQLRWYHRKGWRR